MAEKDIAEKTLEAYNDVFADIINVLLFNGEQQVKEDELEEVPIPVIKQMGNYMHRKGMLLNIGAKDLYGLHYMAWKTRRI